MPMLLCGPDQLYCTHCDFKYNGFPPTLKHPEYKDVAKWTIHPSKKILEDDKFLKQVRTCPNAGKTFRFPEAVQVMDEVESE